MEALSVDTIPTGAEWQYEPKWDGFRCLVFRDGKTITLQSKSGRPLTRYFPELVDALRALKAERFVLDAEIVIPAKGEFSFDDLLQRIHPAASRIQKLALETPALLIVFDLLVNARGERLTAQLLPERRRELEYFLRKNAASTKHLRLSPATTRLAVAKGWLKRVGSALDGVVAKRLDLDYRSGERSGMQKIKNYRSADCVVGGFRYNEGTRVVGSLLLGLYDEAGLLHHVGFTSSIARKDKPALTKKLEKHSGHPGSLAMRQADRAAGRPIARRLGSPLSQNSSSRYVTTISAGSASGTVRGSCAGDRIRRRDNAKWISCSKKSEPDGLV